MACFVAPLTAAIAAGSIKKRIPAKYHIEWLLAMLSGGVAWLVPEHIYHGEVVFYPPFFTAGIDKIIPEILKIGIPMVLVPMLAWLVVLAISNFFKSKKFQPSLPGLALCGAVIMILVDKLL